MTDRIEEMYIALQSKWEEIKKRYLRALNIDGLEPALLTDIAELFVWYEATQKEKWREEIVGKIEELKRDVLPTHAEENGYGCALDDFLAIVNDTLSTNTKGQ